MEKRIEELDKNFKAQELKGGFLYRDVYACENVVVGGLWPGTYCRIGGEYRRRHGAVQGAGKTLCRADAGHAGVGYVPYAPEREQRP